MGGHELSPARKITDSDGFCEFSIFAPSRLCVSSDITQRRRDAKVGSDAHFFHIREGATAIDHKKRQNQKLSEMPS